MATPVTTDRGRVPAAGGNGPEPGGAPQRHSTDLVRVVLGLAVLGIGFLLAQRGQLSLFERDLFRLVNDLPSIVYPLVWLVMQLGNAVTVPALAALALLTRRVRMARDILASGLLAYVIATYVKGVVGRERPAGFDVDAVLRDGTVSGIGFISGHSAVAAALAAAAAPYLSRRGRRVAWTLAWGVALSRVYVGAHLPLDVVGGVAAGWAVGALVHWVLGVPRWQPDAERVSGLLQRLGAPVNGLHAADVVARSSHPFDGVDDRGRRVYVKVLDPDRFERDWLYRLYRVIAVRDIKDADAVAPLDQQAEHEAVAATTARAAGVRVPHVLLARGDAQGAVVVQEFVEGRPLDRLAPEELTPPLLDAVWEQVALLRSSRIAHHDLVASSVLVDTDGRPWIVDFGNAVNGADDDQLARDVAELMASLYLRLEPARVVESAVTGVGADAVAAALPYLAPLSVSRATRTGVRAARRLAPLRHEVRRVLDLPDLDRPQAAAAPVTARILVALGAAVAIIGIPLLAGATAVVESVEAGGWRWLGGALVLAVLARSATALAAMATVERRLALGRVFGASAVADGASLVRGGAGWRAAILRFLQRAGVLPEQAQRAVDRFVAGSAGGAALVAIAALVLAVVEGALTGWRSPESLAPFAALGLGAWALVMAGRFLADHHSPAGRGSWSVVTIRRAVARGAHGGQAASPRRWGAVVGWSSVSVVLEAAALAAGVHAMGSGLPLLETLSVYALLHMLRTMLLVASAPGAADVGLLLALTALGAPLASACAAVLVFRLLTFWVPAALGSLLRSRLEHRLVL
jgi:undecaprenyl-diphosphatase